tara:strand:- start:16455 stop:16895 length:441 start_codon:yes stop_codon:yes gene_type:complete
MANTSNPIIKTANGIVRLNAIVGLITSDSKVHGFDSKGHMRLYLDDVTSTEEKERVRALVMKKIGFNRVLKTPCGNGLSVDIIDDIYINPNSQNLIISSIADGRALLILKADKYSDMELLVDEVQNAFMALNEGKAAAVDWVAHTV